MPESDDRAEARGAALDVLLRAAFDEGVDEGNRGFEDDHLSRRARFDYFSGSLLTRLEKAREGKMTRPFLTPTDAAERLDLLDSEVTWTWLREAFDAGVDAGANDLAHDPDGLEEAYSEFVHSAWSRVPRDSAPKGQLETRQPGNESGAGSKPADSRGVRPASAPPAGTVQPQTDKSTRRSK